MHVQRGASGVLCADWALRRAVPTALRAAVRQVQVSSLHSQEQLSLQRLHGRIKKGVSLRTPPHRPKQNYLFLCAKIFQVEVSPTHPQINGPPFVDRGFTSWVCGTVLR